MTRWIEEGSPEAPLWLVGEAPGGNEVETGRPFTGPAGHMLDGCLREAGLARSTCYLTNVCHERPPSYVNKKGVTVVNDIEQWFLAKREALANSICEVNGRYPAEPIRRGLERLYGQLGLFRPRVVVLLGNTPLWAVGRASGITKWRGSTFQLDDNNILLRNANRMRGVEGAQPDGAYQGAVSDNVHSAVAAFHPADCLPHRSPQHRPLLVHDLARARRILEDPSLAAPTPQAFTVPRYAADIHGWLAANVMPGQPLACDIETWQGQIHCLGLASSESNALCIPFMRAESAEHGRSWWSAADENAIVCLLQQVLMAHPLIFHNGIYDCQYIAKQWGFLPRHEDDTMAMMHVAFPGFLGGKIDPVTGRVDKRGSSLSLSFVSSLFCRHHRYWKDDGRLWDAVTQSEDDYWRYNMEDCCRTWEVAQELTQLLKREALWDQYRLIMRTFAPTYKMMLSGFAVSRDAMWDMYEACVKAMEEDRRWLAAATGIDDINPESSPQMKALFYGDLRQQPIYKGRGADRKVTCDDAALAKIARRTPLLTPLCERIAHYRSMETVRKDCNVKMLSSDGRLRCTMNPAYVETFRFSSNETAFGEGTNLQNFKRA